MASSLTFLGVVFFIFNLFACFYGVRDGDILICIGDDLSPPQCTAEERMKCTCGGARYTLPDETKEKDKENIDGIDVVVRHQNQDMKAFLTDLKFQKSVPNEFPKKLRLLWVAMQAFQLMTGGGIIPSRASKEVFVMFYKLVFKDVEKNVSGGGEIDEEKYQQLKSSLATCAVEKSMTSPEECPTEVFKSLVNGSRYGSSNDMPNSLRFDPENNDVIVEVLWKMAVYTGIKCFSNFRPHLNLYHFYQIQMEEIFLMPIVQRRWFRRTGGIRTMKHTMQVSYLGLRMEQLDRSLELINLNGTIGSKWLRKPQADEKLQLSRRQWESEVGRQEIARVDGTNYILTNVNKESQEAESELLLEGEANCIQLGGRGAGKKTKHYKCKYELDVGGDMPLRNAYFLIQKMDFDKYQ